MNSKRDNNMNPPNTVSNTPDWDELERLVDGRLSRDEYRELLLRIDNHPDGWRKCAMAFLEEQALREELGCGSFSLGTETGDFATENLATTEFKNEDKSLAAGGNLEDKERLQVTSEFLGGSKHVSKKPGAEPAFAEKAKLWMTVAACFVGAFFIGVLASINWSGSNSPKSPLDYINSNPDLTQNLVSTDTNPAGNVVMSLNEPGHDQQVLNVPVYDGEKQADAYLELVEQDIPLELVELLRDSRLHVERNNYVVPVDGESGKRLLVPIEQYQIAPADYWKYQ